MGGHLPSYSVGKTLTGHIAVVNKVQIDKSEVISASGDRKIKIWRLEMGRVRTYPEFPNQRNLMFPARGQTYRLAAAVTVTFESPTVQTEKEEYCLTGPSDMVRSVQAQFPGQPHYVAVSLGPDGIDNFVKLHLDDLSRIWFKRVPVVSSRADSHPGREQIPETVSDRTAGWAQPGTHLSRPNLGTILER